MHYKSVVHTFWSGVEVLRVPQFSGIKYTRSATHSGRNLTLQDVAYYC